jgi:protein phosphatase 2C-like protein
VLAPPYVLAATVTGPSHERDGRSGQDAFAVRHFSEGFIAAVADGLGSVRGGGIGAAIAVEAAVAASSAAEAIIAARTALEAASCRLAMPLSELACTLLVCSAWRAEVVTAHVGDGAAVTDSGLVLSAPGDSEYVDEVVPLTAPGWLAATRVNCTQAVGAIALFTDGCQRAALRRRRGGWVAHPGWWQPLFAHARAAEDASRLAALLDGPRLREHSDDDKTLLIGVLE